MANWGGRGKFSLFHLPAGVYHATLNCVRGIQGELAAFRNDAGCSNIVTWPLRYLDQGRLKAVLGGWDPSDRKFLKTDEITFTVPFEMFKRMVNRWPESFLTTKTWATVRKKIERSREAWGEGE